MNRRIQCPYCGYGVSEKNLERHLKSASHKLKVLLATLRPFDTENRPSILDECARCGHLFRDHNLTCSKCSCTEFMVHKKPKRRGG